MQLATVKDGQPWCCTVHFAVDPELNLYWVSSDHTRHSQEIAAHSQVAAAIVIQFAPGKPVIGVQVEGNAIPIANPVDAAAALRIYTGRHDKGEDFYQNFIAGKAQGTLYKLTPRLYTVFDTENFAGNPRRELVIS